MTSCSSSCLTTDCSYIVRVARWRTAWLTAALLRVLAEPPSAPAPNGDSGGEFAAAGEDPWRGAARELAGGLLVGGRLPALLREPTVAAAIARELRGLRCEAVAADEQRPHPPQRPDSGGGADAAPLLEQPPLSGEATIDSLRAHTGALADDDAAAGLLQETDPELGNRGSGNCCPTKEGGGWAPNGTETTPDEWRNGALIKMIGGKWYKMLWGTQFGFGVRTGPSSPNGSMPNVPSNDPGCPTGCLFDIVAVRSSR